MSKPPRQWPPAAKIPFGLGWRVCWRSAHSTSGGHPAGGRIYRLHEANTSAYDYSSIYIYIYTYMYIYMYIYIYIYV